MNNYLWFAKWGIRKWLVHRLRPLKNFWLVRICGQQSFEDYMVSSLIWLPRK